jgi:hypothetical protein
MANHFSAKFSKKPTSDLENIIANQSKFNPDALEAAVEILESRGVDTAGDLKNARTKKVVTGVGKKPKAQFRFIKSFIKLVIRPDSHRIKTSTKNRLLLTIRFYFLTLLFLWIAAIPIWILVVFGLMTWPTQLNIIPDSFDNSGDIFLASLLIPIIAGIVEETEFRLVLSRFNKRYFDVFVSLLISHLLVTIFGHYFVSNSQYFSSYLIQSIFVYLLLAAPFYVTLSRSKYHSSWFEANWDVLFKYLFYTLAVLFAIAHLPTMELTIHPLFFWPFMILPFLIYALVFSYVRIRIGFAYAILLHITVDMVVMMMKYFS